MNISKDILNKIEQLAISDKFLREIYVLTDDIQIVSIITTILLNKVQELRKELE